MRTRSGESREGTRRKRGPRAATEDGLPFPVSDLTPYQQQVRRACARFWDANMTHMAAALGVARQTVRSWIIGENEVTYRTVAAVAAAAGVVPEALGISADQSIAIGSIRLSPGDDAYALALRLLSAALPDDPEIARLVEKLKTR